MPRFYLHVCNGKAFVEDEEGVELHDTDAARRQAIVGLRDINGGRASLEEGGCRIKSGMTIVPRPGGKGASKHASVPIAHDRFTVSSAQPGA